MAQPRCSTGRLVAFSLDLRPPASPTRAIPTHLWQTKMTGRCPTPAAASFSISCATVCWKGSDSPCGVGGGGSEWGGIK